MKNIMDSQKIEFVGTIVLPEYRWPFDVASAFKQEKIQASNLFQQMLFFDETINYLPEKNVDCFKALTEIKTLNLTDALGANFLPLSPIDICRLIQLDSLHSGKLNKTGACNTILVRGAKPSIVVWHAQVFKSRDVGWKTKLYAHPSVLYGELIFSGHFLKD